MDDERHQNVSEADVETIEFVKGEDQCSFCGGYHNVLQTIQLFDEMRPRDVCSTCAFNWEVGVARKDYRTIQDHNDPAPWPTQWEKRLSRDGARMLYGWMRVIYEMTGHCFGARHCIPNWEATWFPDELKEDDILLFDLDKRITRVNEEAFEGEQALKLPEFARY